jgi:hypothetical protein
MICEHFIPTHHGGSSLKDLIPHVGAGTLIEQTLLADDRAVRIGAIGSLTFDRAIVITQDKWKRQVGGIARHEFLLATAREAGSADEDDDEVLLLRVEGSAPLVVERDLLALREAALRDALCGQQDASPSAVLDVELDAAARERTSFTGLDCQIIGTFYEDNRDGQISLQFGHDIDNFYATATYRVFKPVGDGLSAIASYIRPAGEPAEMARIGAVRYSSTRRRTTLAKQDDVSVEVNVGDFIGTKTGIFGMTRMGKSNTMKSVAARVFAVSERRRAAGQLPIGQLILDPQGEYADPDDRSGTELAAIGSGRVVVYKFGASGRQQNVRPLGFNFYDPGQIEAVKGIISSVLADAHSDYVRAFLQADFAGHAIVGEARGESEQRAARASRGRLLLYGALAKADYQIPGSQADQSGKEWPWRARVQMRRDLADELEKQLGQGHLDRAQDRRTVGIESGSLTQVIDWIIERAEKQDLPGGAGDGLRSFVRGEAWQSALPIYMQLNHGRAVSGYAKLKPLKPFHAPQSRLDYRKEIYRELTAGKIVIVDMHLGPDVTIRELSRNLADFLMERQTEVFAAGQEPPHIQVALGEASSLFSAQRCEEGPDIWMRMASGADKLNIGMLYAAQQVTAVAYPVLATTRNWVVAHLNNSTEVQELAKFYDFEAFGDAIIGHEDQGYVRLKMMSSPYVVPVQIDRYGIELVNEARLAAGLPALTTS